MISNVLKIDGVDISTYGIALVDVKNLLTAPPLKKIDTTEWPDEDGISAELSNPKLDTKSFTLQFWAQSIDLARSFIHVINNGAYHVFDFAELGCVRKLRYSSENDRTIISSTLFTLNFNDDTPFYDFTTPTDNSVLIPNNTTVNQSGYGFDNYSFASYGAYVLQGTDASLTKFPDIKSNLSISVNGSKGLTYYDNDLIKYKSKEASIYLFMFLPKSDFWINYNKMLYNLCRIGERLLNCSKLSMSFNFYYKSLQCTELAVLDNKIWCKLSLNIEFTNYRP